MTQNTSIEWCDHTFNPWIGCTKVSPACDNCYAENMAKRFSWAKWGAGEARRLSVDDYWKQPLKWNKAAKKEGRRARVFCASLSDIFDNEVPDAWRSRLWELIFVTPHLDWLLLTKRIGNAHRMLPWAPMSGVWHKPWSNVWLGSTVVNQEEADRDIPKLLGIPSTVHFLSMEPLLEPVHLKAPWMRFISWIIVGGESGSDARALHPDAARYIRDQCIDHDVPFLFKQWGEWQPLSTSEGFQILPFGKYVLPDGNGKGFGFIKRGKKASGRILDGRTWDQFPEVKA